ncbi:MAG: aldehyde dehydrogenase [Candidatus Kapaibacteriales bacterium]
MVKPVNNMEKLRIQNFIGGKFKDSISGNVIDNYNPATGKVYSLIPDSDIEDVEEAIEAAKEAFKTWSKTDAMQRFTIMNKISQLIESNLEMLAQAESVDNGKPIRLATAVDIPRASKNFAFYATAALHYSSESHYMPENPAINYTLRRPIGVVGCISPWNLPLYLFTWKIAPALATGNCVVAKPSEVTPMSAYLLSKICEEAGLPKGVLNIVHGTGSKAGAAIVEHKDVKAISFTGGTSTGEQIARTAAPMFKKLSLELGGKNPNIIFDDCDYETMLRTTVNSSFANQGQICLCGSRILVQRTIYDKFKQDFVNLTAKMRVGDPEESDSRLGAVVSESHMSKILHHISGAIADGGTILHGGKRATVEGRCENGYFIEPTIIEGLDKDAKINQEEVFGPLVTLIPFDTEEEALEIANSTRYGLSGTIWTNDLNRAHRVAEQLEAGIIWINCWLIRDLRTPFGGVKDSGVGREGGQEALRFFTEPKNICIKY